jgi:uncharacterized membrane protein
MIQLHTSHGWLRPDLRSGHAWNVAQFFGGLAAPIFLLLAGLSAGLQWGRSPAERPRVLPAVTRALQLVVLGYLLRMQMWVIDAGAYARVRTYPAQLCLLGAYAGAYYAASLLAEQPRRALRWWVAAVAAWALGLAQVGYWEPERLRGLMRVDVLQCIGASLLVLQGLAARRLPSRLQLIAIAALIGLATPWMRAWVPGPLPEALAGYLGQWPAPDGKPVLALFPLFPWLGFACVGAALGLAWSRTRTRDALEHSLIITIAIGACCAYFASEAWPVMFRIVRDHDWLSGLVRLVYKVGLVCALFGLAIAMSQRFMESVAAPIRAFGRTSLLVYWVHLEFAFGAAARPFARKLDLKSWAIDTLLLITAMCLLSFIRLHLARSPVRWKLGRASGTVPN